MQRQVRAGEDVRECLSLWKLIATLSWLDIKLRYRGSILGPFWVTLSTGVMVGALGIIYSALFGQQMADYLPYLALSLVLWNSISGMISDGCMTFVSAEGMIKSMRMPFTLHASRVMLRNIILLMHNIVIVVFVFALYGIVPGVGVVTVIPAAAIWLLDGAAACMLLGAVCARFRDVPQIVGSIVQIAFYATPIVWKAEQIKEGAQYMPLNPFFSLLEIVRAPLFGGQAAPIVWASALTYSVLLCAVSWLVFARVRSRLAFWV